MSGGGRESFLQRFGDILTDLKEQQEIFCTIFFSFLPSLKYSFLSRAKNVKGKMILYNMYKQQLSFKLSSSLRDSNFYHLFFCFSSHIFLVVNLTYIKHQFLYILIRFILEISNMAINIFIILDLIHLLSRTIIFHLNILEKRGENLTLVVPKTITCP